MYAYHGGTTNLREHLKRCRSETQAKEKESKKSAVSTSAGTRRIDSVAVSTAVKKCPPAKSSLITELAANGSPRTCDPYRLYVTAVFGG